MVAVAAAAAAAAAAAVAAAIAVATDNYPAPLASPARVITAAAAAAAAAAASPPPAGELVRHRASAAVGTGLLLVTRKPGPDGPPDGPDRPPSGGGEPAAEVEAAGPRGRSRLCKARQSESVRRSESVGRRSKSVGRRSESAIRVDVINRTRPKGPLSRWTVPVQRGGPRDRPPRQRLPEARQKNLRIPSSQKITKKSKKITKKKFQIRIRLRIPSRSSWRNVCLAAAAALA